MRSRKDSWFEKNSYSKRYINTCVVCGHTGYAPQIDDEDFANEGSSLPKYFSRKKLQSMLHHYFTPLPLDEAGRCENCGTDMKG